LALAPERTFYVSEWRIRIIFIPEYLVVWKGFPTEDATYEEERILQLPDLKLLEDKKSWEGRNVMSPSNC
jgi:hypothetical protein